MRTKRLLFIIIGFLFFTFQIGFHNASATASKEEAATALAMAEKIVASAYNATVNAEQTGANISSLLVRLNDAGDELSKAENAYRQRDFNSTIDLANVCSQIAEGVKVEANQLQLEALGPRYMDVWYKVVISIFAMFGVGLGSLLVWRSFKRRYNQRVLRMKPEAVSNES